MTDGMVGRTHRDDKLIRGIRMTQVHAAGKSCQLDRNSSAYGLDRMVIVVDDLDRAVQDYRALGFTVTPPQQVEGSGVRRSCIFFANTDTHLELVSSRAGMAARVLHGLKAVGFTYLRRDALARRALARALKRETFIEEGWNWDRIPVSKSVSAPTAPKVSVVMLLSTNKYS